MQRHTLDDPFNETLRKGGAFPEPFDGIAETWFDGVEALRAPLASPEGKAAMKAIRIDEAGFIDAARSPRWICEEHLLAGD